MLQPPPEAVLLRRSSIPILIAVPLLLLALSCSSGKSKGETTDGQTLETPSVSAAPTIPAEPTTPVVMFLVDQGSSMDGDFGGVSRWQAVQQLFSLSDNGVLAELAGRARTGITLFSGDQGSGGCPLIAGVSPGTDTREQLDTLVNDAKPLSGAPIDAGIEAAGRTLAPYKGERWLVLLTSGAPTQCDSSTGTPADEAAVGAAAAAFAQRIRVVPIALGDEVPQEFLQKIARAGAGMAPNDNTTIDVSVTHNAEELRQALEQLAARVGAQ